MQVKEQRAKWFTAYLNNSVYTGYMTREEANEAFANYAEEWLVSQ